MNVIIERRIPKGVTGAKWRVFHADSAQREVADSLYTAENRTLAVQWALRNEYTIDSLIDINENWAHWIRVAKGDA